MVDELNRKAVAVGYFDPNIFGAGIIYDVDDRFFDAELQPQLIFRIDARILRTPHYIISNFVVNVRLRAEFSPTVISQSSHRLTQIVHRRIQLKERVGSRVLKNFFDHARYSAQHKQFLAAL